MYFTRVWIHQLRWARTIRFCQPVPFFLSILSNATLWPVLWFLIFALRHFNFDQSDAMENWLVAGGLLCLCLGFRIATALQQQMRLTRSTAHFGWWWLVPVKDLMNVAIWAVSFLGNHVEWRGQRFRVLSGGKLLRDP